MEFLQKPLIFLNWFLENEEVSAKVWFFEKEPKIDVFWWLTLGIALQIPC